MTTTTTLADRATALLDRYDAAGYGQRFLRPAVDGTAGAILLDEIRAVVSAAVATLTDEQLIARTYADCDPEGDGPMPGADRRLAAHCARLRALALTGTWTDLRFLLTLCAEG